MGVDISNVPEEELLEVLGDGDWILTLPEGYPDVVITAAMRQTLYDEVARTFVEWTMRGIEVEIDHSFDPEWDRSGVALRRERDPLMLLIKYETIEEWLDKAYTGNSQASYMSGHGLYWDTYGNEFDRRTQEFWSELIGTIAHAQCDDEDDYYDYLESIGDAVVDVEISAIQALTLYIRRGTTNEVWKKYQGEVSARLYQQQAEAKERRIRHSIMRDRVQSFYDLHFADLPRDKMEMPQFREFNVENRLREVLLDADPELVTAMAEVGLPIVVSNKVSDKITNLLRDILKELK
jgi:hypothetical protein